MTTPLSSTSANGARTPRRSPWRALAVWFVAVGAMSLVIAAPVLFVKSLRLERETVHLRDAVIGEFAGRAMDGWSPRVEVRLGGTAFGLARVLTQFADLPDEARQVLRAARSASVGVYQWRGADLAAMRERMSGGSPVIEIGGRSWTRVVSVRDGDESVVVLTPVTDADDLAVLEVCVVVLAEGELVVVSVDVDPAPLSELVQPHLRELSRELDASAI